MTGLEELAWLSQLMLASAAAELAAANISQLTVLEHSMAILLDFDWVPPPLFWAKMNVQTTMW